MFQFYLSSIKSDYDYINRQSFDKFQFYLSSIKSMLRDCFKCYWFMFQFYLSSIKSERYEYRDDDGRCFNSTLVQLKVCQSTLCPVGSLSFNSTLVQLKVFLPLNKPFTLICFNSTLVQLKVVGYTQKILFAKFQFYLSSIKSETLGGVEEIIGRFQFYLSSIKSR